MVNVNVNPAFASERGLGRIGVAGFGIGLLFGIHATLLVVALFQGWQLPFVQWATYFTALQGFHFMEFLSTALWKPKDLAYESFIINHSTAYTIAATASWVEFWLEYAFAPWIKGHFYIFLAGTCVMLIGQFFRSAAMWTARSNFAHRIEESKREDHVLVTHGVYRCLRHPSYFGWFWWSVATQVVLCNPICLVGYALASWDFFRTRIPYEERTLMGLFQDDYASYRRRTIVGIPFI